MRLQRQRERLFSEPSNRSRNALRSRRMSAPGKRRARFPAQPSGATGIRLHLLLPLSVQLSTHISRCKQAHSWPVVSKDVNQTDIHKFHLLSSFAWIIPNFYYQNMRMPNSHYIVICYRSRYSCNDKIILLPIVSLKNAPKSVFSFAILSLRNIYNRLDTVQCAYTRVRDKSGSSVDHDEWFHLFSYYGRIIAQRLLVDSISNEEFI